MDLLPFLIVVSSITWACFFILTSKFRARRSAKLPPGPFPFPIIGSILHLGPNPHRSLAGLSRKYGPLMSLKLGTKTAIVVSSPEIAKLVLQKHDLEFSSRTVPSSMEAVGQDVSLVWLPVDSLWRKLRKICKEEMFSVTKLDAGQGLRREKLRKLCDYVEECCRTGRAVDIGEAAFTTTLNLISSTFFSMDFAKHEPGSAQEMKDVVWGVMKCVGRSNIADYFPGLKWVDPQGISKESRICFDKLFAIFDGIIDEKMKSNGPKNDLTDALLDINRRDDKELSREDIKRLLLDLFVAGTDTSAVTVEWAMTELLRNRDKLRKARAEIQEVIGENGEIQESDIPRLPYLQAVVKETFRLHPPAPFLVPHKAEADVEINGYVIPKNAKILVNMWTVGRDFKVWSNADCFVPERFLDHNDMDFRGTNFELIPFGAGRRICPGLPLANRMVHLMLGSLMLKFGWKLEEGMESTEIDMNEKFGLTLQRAEPLKAIPTLGL